MNGNYRIICYKNLIYRIIKMKFNKLWRGISLSLLSVALLLSKQGVKAEQLILDPPQGSEQGTPIAVIWIHGMQCNP